MKYSAAAVLAAAAGVMAGLPKNVTYTTEVVEVYTTYCPEPTTLTHGDKTYTVTEPTTLTITDCPCTISKPIVTSSAVHCYDCPPPPPPPQEPPKNATSSWVVVPTPSEPPHAPSAVPTAGAGKAAALSGAGLAGVLGLAAFVL